MSISGQEAEENKKKQEAEENKKIVDEILKEINNDLLKNETLKTFMNNRAMKDLKKEGSQDFFSSTAFVELMEKIKNALTKRTLKENQESLESIKNLAPPEKMHKFADTVDQMQIDTRDVIRLEKHNNLFRYIESIMGGLDNKEINKGALFSIEGRGLVYQTKHQGGSSAHEQTVGARYSRRVPVIDNPEPEVQQEQKPQEGEDSNKPKKP